MKHTNTSTRKLKRKGIVFQSYVPQKNLMRNNVIKFVLFWFIVLLFLYLIY